MSSHYNDLYQDRFLPASVEDSLIGWLARIAGLCILATVAVLWLAIITWSAKDPSLMHATGGEISNSLGYLGATLSDLLLQTFGMATALLLLAPMFWGLELVISQRIHAFSAKTTYFPLAILILAGALSALPVATGWPLHHGFGGILGDAIYRLGTNIMLLVAPERAGVLTGLAFFATGSAAVAYSIGIEMKDINAVLKSRAHQLATAATRREPILTGLDHDTPAPTKSWRANWFGNKDKADTHISKHDGNNEHFDHAFEPTFDDPHYTPRDPGPGPAIAQPHQQTYDAHTREVTHTAHYQTAVPQQRAPAQYAQAHTPTHVQDPRYAPAPRYTPQQMAPQATPATNNRGHDFDGTTDEASRMMARRFAPASLQQAQPHPQANVVQHPSNTHQPQPNLPQSNEPQSTQPQSKQPMFSGMKFNRGQSKYQRPSLNLLKRPTGKRPSADHTQTVLRGTARLLEDVLADFGVKGTIRNIKPGPVVTLFELEPSRGTKSSRVIGLADDIARSMSATSARIAVVPGANAIGIELPNARKEPVLLREIIDAEAFRSFAGALPIALGKSISGEPVIADLTRMPHLLVAGTTGSGKSVGVNAMITSLLYRMSPAQCRLLLIDPKMLELSVYNGIPHLLTPVITDSHKAVAALNWVVGEMEERYKRMSKLAVRNIGVFNNRVLNARKRGEMIARTVQTGFDRHTGQAIYEQQQMEMEPMPYIVVVIDEFADLMCVAGKEVEAAVQRIAQMARAAGIHLIMATQRPSVDVITGTIKANFPARISFKVASKVDSRTILNEQGAEQLLGQGDMLFSSGAGHAVRVHGPFVSDTEVENIAVHLRDRHTTNYVEGITDGPPDDEKQNANGGPGGSNPGARQNENDIYDRAVAIVLRDRKATTSYLQRRLSIGYNRAADLIERMEHEKIVTPPKLNGKREICDPGQPGS